MQPEYLDVVTDVPDNVRRRRTGDLDDAANEPRAADSSREDCDVQTRLLSSSERHA